MKKQISHILLPAMLMVSAFASCEREDPKPNDGGNTATAGKGGAAVLNITPKHHSRNIDDCMIYITYNASTPPDRYDDSAKCVDKNGVPVATFQGLKKGNYYLSGVGYDPEIAETVKGGIPFTVEEEKAYDLIMAVSEPHK